MRILLVITFSLVCILCTSAPHDLTSISGLTDGEPALAATTDLDSQPVADEKPEYPGKTIDQIFPILFERSFSDGDAARARTLVPALGLDVEIKAFVPVSLMRGHQRLLRFKAEHSEGYWSSLVGVAHLLGSESNQIYIVSTGPGAVCCTNYWIVDVERGRPREIFRSRDHGSFRDAMEIFDADGDGVYELVQMDSCFRYFMGDCGWCAPEPRAAFKYDKRAGKYLPAVNITQDFVRNALESQERSIKERAAVLKDREDPTVQLDQYRNVLNYFVQLLHLGQEKKAWEIFKKYQPDPSKETLREIRQRLASCPYYQALHHGRVWKK